MLQRGKQGNRGVDPGVLSGKKKICQVKAANLARRQSLGMTRDCQNKHGSKALGRCQGSYSSQKLSGHRHAQQMSALHGPADFLGPFLLDLCAVLCCASCAVWPLLCCCSVAFKAAIIVLLRAGLHFELCIDQLLICPGSLLVMHWPACHMQAAVDGAAGSAEAKTETEKRTRVVTTLPPTSAAG